MTITFKKSALAAVGLLALGACSDSDDVQEIIDTPVVIPTQSYQIEVVNLTANQPMSPIAVLSHTDAVMVWQTGMPASNALEVLAESGDASGFSDLDGVLASANGAGILPPGGKEMIDLELSSLEIDRLSLATMLVNTNDAFTGINGADFASLAVDASHTFYLNAYDAGTEGNTEAKGSIPGPADGGEGYLEARDDIDRVHLHPGVLSASDGLSDSVLGPSHRFDNPVLMVRITRTE
ncbi:spondin domain-containing protein [Paraferrimonas sedimenticola]|uniref:Spondin domain-containing protein n=1 Tax=Paraferrimonas sedimenticola TaxID=375674 RepID=A0AA37RW09_9GAMM|nr:spondin domain-containing protein [Paraferrimonas sedimenticola]GLP96188.1 hypothetical protein GCM10007895_14940 [Paraferrimonas sedimenticola]